MHFRSFVKGGLLAAFILAMWCLAVPLAPWANAQGAIQQAGPATPGHALAFVQNGVAVDSGAASGATSPGGGLSELLVVARGTGVPPYAGQGTGPYGTNVCDYDAPVTNATGYHYICLSPNAQNGGLLAFGAGGAATQLPLNFIVNGSTYTFPFTTQGILGPNTSTINDVVLWNNTTGSLVKDGGTVPLLGANNTFTGTNIFSGPVTTSSTLTLNGNVNATSGTVTLGSALSGTSAVFSGNISAGTGTSPGQLTLGSTGNPNTFSIQNNATYDFVAVTSNGLTLLKSPAGSGNIWVGGSLGIGMAPTQLLDIGTSLNGEAEAHITNTSNGTAAAAGWLACNNSPTCFNLAQTSTTFPPAGAVKPDQTFLNAGGTNGLLLNTITLAPIVLAINGAEAARIATNGALTFNGFTGVGAFQNGQVQIGGNSGGGFLTQAAGSVDDYTFTNKNGNTFLQVPTGTTSIALGNGVLVNTATSGFVYVPTTTSAIPSGTPATVSGFAPIVVDPTDNKFCFYNGSAWKCVTGS